MLEFLFCVISIKCSYNAIKDAITDRNYPPDVAELCQYFEKGKEPLPDYCLIDKPSIPRRRSEF